MTRNEFDRDYSGNCEAVEYLTNTFGAQQVLDEFCAYLDSDTVAELVDEFFRMYGDETYYLD